MTTLIFGRNLRASLGIGTRKGTRSSPELEATRMVDHGLPERPSQVGPVAEAANPRSIKTLPLNSKIVIVTFSMTQTDLEQLVKRIGHVVEDLEITPQDDKAEECDGTGPCIDFAPGGISFPKLRVLCIEGQTVRSMHLTEEQCPKLEVLSWEQDMGRKLAYWKMGLPELTTCRLGFLELADSTGWATSFASLPKLNHFVAYKLWGLATHSESNPHHLSLPACTHLVLIRSDDLDYLSLDAPKLKLLNLRACYNVRGVSLSDGPKKSSKFHLVTINASSDLASTALACHQRCSKIIGGEDDSGLGSVEQEERDRHAKWNSLPLNSPKRPPAASYVHVVVEKDMFGFTTGKTDATSVQVGGTDQSYHVMLDHMKAYAGGPSIDRAAGMDVPMNSGWRLWSKDRSAASVQKMMDQSCIFTSKKRRQADQELDSPSAARPKAKAKIVKRPARKE